MVYIHTLQRRGFACVITAVSKFTVKTIRKHGNLAGNIARLGAYVCTSAHIHTLSIDCANDSISADTLTHPALQATATTPCLDVSNERPRIGTHLLKVHVLAGERGQDCLAIHLLALSLPRHLGPVLEVHQPVPGTRRERGNLLERYYIQTYISTYNEQGGSNRDR